LKLNLIYLRGLQDPREYAADVVTTTVDVTDAFVAAAANNIAL
jgi:hypothetical protein